MEEEKDLAVTGEGTPAPSASETEPVEATETSKVGTSDQPEAETTEQPISRAQERIQKLAAERNYWKDIAQANAPAKEEAVEDGEITVEAIANTVVSKIDQREAARRAKEAEALMLQDAITAEQKYPKLAKDQELADDVIAFAQAKGITILAAADRLVGLTEAREIKSQAELQAKAGSATPTGSKASSGEPSRLNTANMTETEKAARWNEVLNSYQEE